MKLISLLFLCTVLLACSNPKKADQTQDIVTIDPESVEAPIPEDEEPALTPPEFSESQLDLFQFLGEDTWVEQTADGEEIFFAVSLNDGFYTFTGFMDETYFLADIEVNSESSYFITFHEGDITFDMCYSLVVLSDNSISIEAFDQCARGSGLPTTYTRNGVDDGEAGPVEYTVIARWESINNFQGDLDYYFVTPEGDEISFSIIEMDGFSDDDNDYFTSQESEESMFLEYVLKEEIKDVYFQITYILDKRTIDLADEEEEVKIIVGMVVVG